MRCLRRWSEPEKTEQAGLKQPPEFVLGDALRLVESGLKAMTVLDCALFHTFSDEERKEYIRGLEAVLSQGGGCTFFRSVSWRHGNLDQGGSVCRKLREVLGRDGGWRIQCGAVTGIVCGRTAPTLGG